MFYILNYIAIVHFDSHAFMPDTHFLKTIIRYKIITSDHKY